MTDPPLTSAARHHIDGMFRLVAPAAARLDREFRKILRKRPISADAGETPAMRAARVRALCAITPGAASRVRSLADFLEQVDYNGRRLAKLNVNPEQAGEALGAFDALLEPLLAGGFQPAREQFRLLTVLQLNKAFYQVRELETQAFFGLHRAETESASLDEMLQGFVQALAGALRARAGTILLEQPKARRPLYVERGAGNERLVAPELARSGCQSYWLCPAGDTAVLQLAFPTRYPWLPRELTLLQAAAKRCAAAIERARLESEARRLSLERLRAEADERRRIGRELHDEAGQSLLLLRLRLEMLERDAPAELAARIAGAREIAEHTVGELRRILAALSPAVLERLGLAAALRNLLARFRTMHTAALRARIAAPAGLSRLEEETIYRVAQEALQNIVKHSAATRVMFSLESDDRRIRLRIVDNGAGFQKEKAGSKPTSFGLAGMRERVALIGGALAVRSVPGKGAEIALELPRVSERVASHVEHSRTAG
jgi:signal transduction histidine kinase